MHAFYNEGDLQQSQRHQEQLDEVVATLVTMHAGDWLSPFVFYVSESWQTMHTGNWLSPLASTDSPQMSHVSRHIL